MKVVPHTGNPVKTQVDTLTIGIFAPPAKRTASKKTGAKKKRAPSCPEHFKAINKALDDVAWRFAYEDDFTGESGQTFVFHTHGKISATRLVLIGLGDPAEIELDDFRKLGGAAFQSCQGEKAILVLPKTKALTGSDVAAAVAEGCHLASYKFDKYLSDNSAGDGCTEVAVVLNGGLSPKAAKNALEKGRIVSDGVCLARDLVNDCPSALDPTAFAEIAKTVGRQHKLQIRILTEKELAREKMGLMLAVSKASTPYVPPRLVRIAYRPKGKIKRHVALVGKGVTFDSGGLDIKPAAGMLEMKIDMSGAAAVLGAMRAIGELAPAGVAVTGYLGCVENGIGGNAYHPSDVITSRQGTTVEVNNTDAEGRLVLADCIDYAIEKDKPDLLIDLATLTGACMVALGPQTSAVFTDHDKLAEDIQSAGELSGEDFWRLPLNQNLRYQLKSNVADTKNTGERFGGAITAALFLEHFVGDRVPWAHLDIAGPATMNKEHPYTPRGGAGFGVRTLVRLIAS